VNTGLAALIMGLAPIVTLAVAPLVHREESLGWGKALGAAAGLSGVALLVLPDISTGLNGDLLPRLALVAAALCYAFTALFSRRFPLANPMAAAAASVLAGTAVMGAVLLLTFDVAEGPQATVQSVGVLFYLGLGPTALAALIYFYLIPRIGAGRLQQVNYVVPVVGVLLGMIVLGEVPVWTTWLALPVILAGVFLVTRQTDKPEMRDRRELASVD